MRSHWTESSGCELAWEQEIGVGVRAREQEMRVRVRAREQEIGVGVRAREQEMRGWG